MFSKRIITAFSSPVRRSFSTTVLPPPRLFDYATIRKHLRPTQDSINAVESAFSMMSKGLVDVPIPMHIGIPESEVSFP
jgi:hypothetical protein